MGTPKEGSESIFHGTNQISKVGLARELGVNPMNFSKQRKGFEEWFKKAIKIERGVTIAEMGTKGTKMTIIPDQNIFFQIPDGHLLPLYLTKIPLEIESIDEWKLFLGYYTQLFHAQSILKMREIIQNNPDDLFDQLTDHEIRYIMVSLFDTGKCDGKLPDDMIRRLQETSGVVEPNFREDREVWGKRRGMGALFARNIVAREKPEHDIPYLDEFLCYFDGLFFRNIITECLFKNVPLLQSWITARSDLLADTSTQVNKLFCQIFCLSEEGFFDDEGNINTQALVKIPVDFHDAFFCVERRRKELIIQKNKAQEALLEKEKILEEKRLLEEKTKHRITAILEEKITGSCTPDFILSLHNIPPEIHTIEVTFLRNNKKVYARAVIDVTFGNPIDLTQCRFETFSPNKNNQSWDAVSDWRGGDNYAIVIAGKIGKEKTPENEVYSWRQEKTKKAAPEYPVVIQTTRTISAVLSKHPSTPQSSITTSPVSPAVTTKPLKSAQEQEKEDLQTALEFFLEKSPKELQDFFIDHHVWDEESQALTLSVPIEELEEMSYVPKELSVAEYGALLQWTATKKQHQWVTPEDTPQKIKNIFGVVFGLLAQKIERGEIDNQLSVIGFPPSDTDDNSALKTSIQIDKNIDIKGLLKKIGEIQEEFKKQETPFNFYYGPLGKDNIPNSISLLSKRNWLAILTLKPTIAIELKTVNGKPLPQNAPLLTKRIENALLNFIYQYLKNGRGISSIIRRTTVQENTQKLRESYRRELKKKTARLLIEKPDGITFTIIEGISTEGLQSAIQGAQIQYGVEKVALLYRKSTYAFPGDTSISKPSPQRSEEDYTSLNIPERRIILRERILKTLFNGNSKVKDRAAFVHGSAVFQALQFEVAAFREKNERDITQEDISEDFLTEFIDILQSRQVLISYRDYCAGWVEDLTELGAE